MKKLPMAAFLTPEHPPFFLEALQNLANFHDISVLRPSGDVNAERNCSGRAGRARPACNKAAIPPLPEARSFANQM